MNYYEAVRYGVKDEKLSKEVYDKFMPWGMYKQAFDIYMDNHIQAPDDSERYYLAAQAGIRMGHPVDWATSYLYDQFANLSTHSDRRNRKACIFIAARYLANFKQNKQHRVILMGQFFDANKIDERSRRILTTRAEEAKKVHKGDPRPFRFLAIYYDIEKEYEKAYKELKDAENLKGFNDTDRAFLAILAARIGKLDEAKKYAEESLKSISSANAHFALGKYYLDKKDYGKAEEELNKALMLEQWDPGIYLDYSAALEKTGNKKKAERYKKFASYMKVSNSKNIREIDYCEILTETGW